MKPQPRRSAPLERDPQPSVPSDLAEAARAFFPDATRIEAVGAGALVRVEAPPGDWSVRRWRPGTSEGRIRFVHDLLRTIRDAGIDVVPAVGALPGGEEVLDRDGSLYDAQGWLPGGPVGRATLVRGPGGESVNLPAPLAEAATTETIKTVARIHGATQRLARARGAPFTTLSEVARAVQDGWERARARLRPVAATTPAVQRWIRAGERALPAAVRDLAAASSVFHDASVVGHGDLWPAHVLWQRAERGSEGQARLSGIVDWTDAAAASPLLDLAQLVGHFGGWSGRNAEEAIGAYAAVRRLDPDERRLLPAVAVLDLVAEAGWLLTLAYADADRGEQTPSALRDGADAIVASLENAAEVAVRGDRPAKPVRRRWVRRAPAPARRDDRPDR
jgi:Ser/Thr protein kinase RdoA (MazF antagonist)